ncbi:CehA/McbA family metallohydrolase [Nocardioides sp. SYSU DS0663]|uniref:CehA/McbA family metallohydrolase n=1 Tax=Nocardioides sp. SYSU DS0663 TaxID=3416445 RepID=UPI003F4C2C66
MCDRHLPPLTRRSLLAAGPAGAVVVGATGSAEAAGSRTLTFSGRFTGVGTPDWHYLPFRMPRGVREVEVRLSHEKLDTGVGLSFNIIDLGILGPGGSFRGWSGGAREQFRISRSRATPGYLAGDLDPGTWRVVLGPFTVVPPGVEWTVTVTLRRGAPGRRFRPRPAPRAVRGTGPGWYRGDLHTHTVHSDGRWTQARLLAAARAAGLDFLASTEHNTSSAHLTWGRQATDDFLVIPGEEVTTRAGHCVAFGQPAGAWLDWRFRDDASLARVTGRVRRLGGVSIAAHPHVPTSGSTWSYGYDEVDAVEVWNGPWTLDDEATLATWHAQLVAAPASGTWLPAVGSSDTHHEGQPVGTPHTVVRAETLSVGAVVAAVRAGRAWLAETSDVDLALTATAGDRTASCGDALGAGPAEPVDVRLEVTGVPGCLAQLVGPLGPLAGAVADGSGAATLSATVAPALAPFVRAEVRRLDGEPVLDPLRGVPGLAMVALTNPVWLGRPPGISPSGPSPAAG